MAQNALESRAAARADPRVRDRRGAAHQGTLDLKTRGTRLFVDAARVFALAFGIAETGTAARLRAAGKRMQVEDRHRGGDDRSAFTSCSCCGFASRTYAAGHGAANRIDPDALNEVDQRMLKEAFRQARKLQQRLAHNYQL